MSKLLMATALLTTVTVTFVLRVPPKRSNHVGARARLYRLRRPRGCDQIYKPKAARTIYYIAKTCIVSFHAATIKCSTDGYRQIGGKENGTRSLGGSSVKTETNRY